MPITSQITFLGDPIAYGKRAKVVAFCHRPDVLTIGVGLAFACAAAIILGHGQQVNPAAMGAAVADSLVWSAGASILCRGIEKSLLSRNAKKLGISEDELEEMALETDSKRSCRPPLMKGWGLFGLMQDTNYMYLCAGGILFGAAVGFGKLFHAMATTHVINLDGAPFAYVVAMSRMHYGLYRWRRFLSGRYQVINRRPPTDLATAKAQKNGPTPSLT